MENRKEESSEDMIPDQPTLELIIINEIVKKARSMSPLDIEASIKKADEIEELICSLRRQIHVKKLDKERRRNDIKSKSCIPNWRKKMKERKWSYYYHLKNKRTSEIYLEWYRSDDIILPKHMIPKQSKNDFEEEYAIKLKLAKEKMKHEAEIMNIRSRKYAQKYKSIDSEVQDNILIATLENHQKRNYLLKAWDEEYTAQEARSLNIWRLKEEFMWKKQYINKGDLKKTDKMQNIGKETKPRNSKEAKTDDTGKPKNKKVKHSLIKAQKEKNSLVKPNIENNVFSPYNSRHEIERDYLNEMDEMIRCEDNNIYFDRAKLEKLTEILERLNKEDEDFRKADIHEEIAEVDRRDRHLKEETNYDYMSTASEIVNKKFKEISNKSKVPPISKIPVLFPKMKNIRRQIDFSLP